jgi:tetratricopeptide (TPR) repeat protein
MKKDLVIERMMREAIRHHQAGRLIEATRVYEQILKLDSSHADSLHLLGMISYQARIPDLAIDLIQRAIAINCKSAPYHASLGAIFQSQGKLDEAEAQYTLALGLDPGLAETLGSLGSVLLAQGKLSQSVICFKRAIALKPDIAEFHFLLGNTLYTQGMLTDAVICYERSLALKSDYAEAHCNTGNALTALNRFYQAAIHYRKALAINPTLAAAQNGLDSILKTQSSQELKIEHYQRGLAVGSDNAEAHKNDGELRDVNREEIFHFDAFSDLEKNISAPIEHLKCAVITPIGPGHEGLVDEARASVEAAFRTNPGPFTDVLHLPMADFAGEHGRSKRRNDGIDYALANDIDWIFFLDADDLMALDAFASVVPYIKEFDAIFGLIAESRMDTPHQVNLRPNQLGATTDILDVLRYEPFLSLQMGHFVRTKAADAVRFDTTMDAGEDFTYYLNLWNQHRCAKIDRILFINRRGSSSTGPRSADGGRWCIAARRAIKVFHSRHAIKIEPIQDLENRWG